MIEYLNSMYFFIDILIFMPLIGLIIKFRPVFQYKASRIFAIYFFVALLEWVASMTFSFLGMNNIIISNIYAVLQFFFLSIFFTEIIKIKKNIALPIISVISATSLIIVLTLHNDTYNSIFHLSAFLLFIALSLIYFLKLLRNQEVDDLLKFPVFYFVTAISFDFSTSTFIIMFANYFLAESQELLMTLWPLHSIINTITYIFITIGFLTCRKTQKY